MTPLLFISIAVIVLSLLVYWVLSTIKDPQSPNSGNPDNDFRYAYDFEIAPELSVYPENKLHLDPNTIKLSGQDAAHLTVYWNLEQEMLEKTAQETDLHLDASYNLVLRLYESSDLLGYHDFHITRMVGCCRLQVHPSSAYYVSLGILDNQRFIPVITSNTVIKQK